MIWVLIKRVLLWLLRLVYAPPAGYRSRINPNAQCPVCGNCKGDIEFARCAGNASDLAGTPMVKHVCYVCHFSWWEDVVSMSKKPAV